MDASDAAQVRPKPPLPLKIAAGMLFLMGLASIATTLYSLIGDRLHLDLSFILYFLAYAGILRGSRGWRLFTLIIMGLAFVFCALAIGWFLLDPDGMIAHCRVGGRELDPSNKWLAYTVPLVMASWAAIFLALMHLPQARAYFRRPPTAEREQ